MKIVEYKAAERGEADFGWFKAKYSFSFGQWHNPERMGFGALRVFNDSIIQPHKGFPEHPHDNMEVITIQLQGRLQHTDVSGTRIIQAGDVQVISAGKGVTHSDLNLGEDEAKQFQIWLMPNKQNVTPVSNIKSFNPQDKVEKWQTLISPVGNNDSELKIQQQAWINRGEFKSNQNINYSVKSKNNGVYIFVISGSIKIENTILAARDAAGITEIENVNINIIENADILIVDTII